MFVKPYDPKPCFDHCSQDISHGPKTVHTPPETFAIVDGVRHIRFDQVRLEVVVRAFWPVQFALYGMKFIQKKSATIYGKLSHHPEKAV